MTDSYISHRCMTFQGCTCSGVTDIGEKGRIAPPGKLHVKTGRPISLYFIFAATHTCIIKSFTLYSNTVRSESKHHSLF